MGPIEAMGPMGPMGPLGSMGAHGPMGPMGPLALCRALRALHTSFLCLSVGGSATNISSEMVPQKWYQTNLVT